MKPLRQVSKLEKILFPIIVTLVVGIILPDSIALLGMLMLGNLFKCPLVTLHITLATSKPPIVPITNANKPIAIISKVATRAANLKKYCFP